MVHRVVVLDIVVAAGIGVVVGLAMVTEKLSSLAWLLAEWLQLASV